jgi:hypothetical protein
VSDATRAQTGFVTARLFELVPKPFGEEGK